MDSGCYYDAIYNNNRYLKLFDNLSIKYNDATNTLSWYYVGTGNNTAPFSGNQSNANGIEYRYIAWMP